jgi:DNA-binding FadR family transcriptional regulator
MTGAAIAKRTTADGDAPARSDRQAEPLSDGDVLSRLHSFIHDKGLQPGDRLPPERALCEALDLRRTELRRAFDALERDGAIWRHVGRGTFLSTNSDQSQQDRLSAAAKRIGPADLMRARTAIEPAIAREAALSASAAQLAALRATARQGRRAQSWGEYETLDKEFHRQIAEASGSQALLVLFDELNVLRRLITSGRQPRLGARPPQDHPSFDQHDAIVAALSACDPDAAQQAMRAHLRSVEDRLIV